ncbi:DUF1648 domain-containing protein [Viridibacillus sp. NPDC096237]|uniref:DUF1648 domain-containing protein n=1 Tax=Viridibacillus sp. NPDC096237 TaxID=3390721 RepID=UPI003D04DEE4
MDFLAIVAFVGAIIYGITQWSILPVQVPIHYNTLGEPDGWGSKWVFFIVPALAVALWIF